MQWHSAAEFLAMGGYAFYVWGSFGLCAVTMLVEPLLLRRRRRRIEQALRRRGVEQALHRAGATEAESRAPTLWRANHLEGSR